VGILIAGSIIREEKQDPAICPQWIKGKENTINPFFFLYNCLLEKRKEKERKMKS